MGVISPRKLHVAPLARQERAIRALLRAGRFRNVTEFVRVAIDHYLERLGRPSLTGQAQQMAEDFHANQTGNEHAIDLAQDASRATDERW